MKPLKILIAILLVVLVGTLGYFAYSYIKNSRIPAPVSFETPRPFQASAKSSQQVAVDYTSANLPSGQPRTLTGTFVVLDNTIRVIDGISYTNVITIKLDDQSLAKIWLTEDQFNQVKGIFPNQGVRVNEPIAIFLSNQKVSIKTPYNSINQ